MAEVNGELVDAPQHNPIKISELSLFFAAIFMRYAIDARHLNSMHRWAADNGGHHRRCRNTAQQ